MNHHMHLVSLGRDVNEATISLFRGLRRQGAVPGNGNEPQPQQQEQENSIQRLLQVQEQLRGQVVRNRDCEMADFEDMMETSAMVSLVPLLFRQQSHQEEGWLLAPFVLTDLPAETPLPCVAATLSTVATYNLGLFLHAQAMRIRIQPSSPQQQQEQDSYYFYLLEQAQQLYRVAFTTLDSSAVLMCNQAIDGQTTSNSINLYYLYMAICHNLAHTITLLKKKKGNNHSLPPLTSSSSVALIPIDDEEEEGQQDIDDDDDDDDDEQGVEEWKMYIRDCLETMALPHVDDPAAVALHVYFGQHSRSGGTPETVSSSSSSSLAAAR